MTLRVADTLTADNSEKYEVSIRLWPGGLSFSGYILHEKDSFFTETFFFDGNQSMAQSLKNTFFDNQFFSYLYRSVSIIYVSGKYTLVPDDVFAEKYKSLLFSFCHHNDKDETVLVYPLKELQSKMLYAVDNEVYEFLVRSLVNPHFVHSLSPLIVAWQKKSLTSYPKRIYAFIHDKILDIACFDNGEMLFVNAFDYEKENDIIYYLLYACRQLGVNQLEDIIHFCGDKMMCHSVMSVIKNYIKEIDYLMPQSDSFTVAADNEVYYDVATSMQCE